LCSHIENSPRMEASSVSRSAELFLSSQSHKRELPCCVSLLSTTISHKSLYQFLGLSLVPQTNLVTVGLNLSPSCKFVVTPSAQEWWNHTLVGHESLIWSKIPPRQKRTSFWNLKSCTPLLLRQLRSGPVGRPKQCTPHNRSLFTQCGKSQSSKISRTFFWLKSLQIHLHL